VGRRGSAKQDETEGERGENGLLHEMYSMLLCKVEDGRLPFTQQCFLTISEFSIYVQVCQYIHVNSNIAYHS
jgi:hypothetical protein